MYKETAKEVLDFIQKSPSCFHAIQEIGRQLRENGFEELRETDRWSIKKGGSYFTTRNGSSLIAFRVGKTLDDYHFQVTSSHCDSPTFKVKEKAELKGKGGYLQLNTEGYGGMICSSWMDRPLSLAGRVLVREGNTVTSRLVAFDRDLLIIPNVAIHMNRSINDGFAFNKQVDMLPLFSAGECGEDSYRELIAQELGVDPQSILGMDMYLYNRTAPSIWGFRRSG